MAIVFVFLVSLKGCRGYHYVTTFMQLHVRGWRVEAVSRYVMSDRAVTRLRASLFRN